MFLSSSAFFGGFCFFLRSLLSSAVSTQEAAKEAAKPSRGSKADSSGGPPVKQAAKVSPYCFSAPFLEGFSSIFVGLHVSIVTCMYSRVPVLFLSGVGSPRPG